MSVFDHKEYKKYVANRLKDKDSKRGIQSSMARFIGCQSAFIYQVLNGKGDFTEDQAFKITQFFKFNKMEQEYFLLLVRFNKSSNNDYKSFLKKELEKLSEENSDLKTKVAATILTSNENDFLDWYSTSSVPTIVHILSSSSNYQTSKKLGEKLNIPENILLKILHELEKNNFVKKDGNKWIYNNPSVHFEKGSKSNYQIQLNRRIQAMGTLNQNLRKEDTFFTSLFTLDRGSVAKLENLIAEFVQNSHKIIHQGGTDEAYIINLDLFAI